MWKFTVRSVRPRITPISQLVFPIAAHPRQVISLADKGFMSVSPLLFIVYLSKCINYLRFGKTGRTAEFSLVIKCGFMSYAPICLICLRAPHKSS